MTRLVKAIDDAPSRIQIAIDHVLVLEVIGSWAYIDKLWARWSVHRWKNGLPFGGAIIQLASKPRVWDVPVGGEIPHKEIK